MKWLTCPWSFKAFWKRVISVIGSWRVTCRDDFWDDVPSGFSHVGGDERTSFALAEPWWIFRLRKLNWEQTYLQCSQFEPLSDSRRTLSSWLLHPGGGLSIWDRQQSCKQTSSSRNPLKVIPVSRYMLRNGIRRVPYWRLSPTAAKYLTLRRLSHR